MGPVYNSGGGKAGLKLDGLEFTGLEGWTGCTGLEGLGGCLGLPERIISTVDSCRVIIGKLWENPQRALYIGKFLLIL